MLPPQCVQVEHARTVVVEAINAALDRTQGTTASDIQRTEENIYRIHFPSRIRQLTLPVPQPHMCKIQASVVKQLLERIVAKKDIGRKVS